MLTHPFSLNLLLLCALRSLAALWPCRAGSSREAAFATVHLLGSVLVQDVVVEVDEGVDGDTLTGRVVIEDGVNRLLHLHRWHSFVILSCSFRHVQIELENVVELISWIEVS